MPQQQQNTFQKRQVAYKVRIADIINSQFVKDDISAGYVKIGISNVARVNILATLVDKSEDASYASAVIDDGTGRIPLRSFDNMGLFLMLNVGDTILVIGRVREFNNERYMMPEILKKINDIGWVNVRSIELKSKKRFMVDEAKNGADSAAGQSPPELDSNVYELIKKLDNGDGVPVEDVISKSNKPDAEQTLKMLLENGDIFEVRPGKLKVLE